TTMILQPVYAGSWTTYAWDEADFATIIATEAAERAITPILQAEIRLREWIRLARAGTLDAPIRPLVVALAALGERREAIIAEIVLRVRPYVLASADPEAALHRALIGAGFAVTADVHRYLVAALGPLLDELAPLFPELTT
ncbi:MAG: hypothetical protein M3176_12450, partial [Chloroflexota bacterium]|nr:hypothetical protein [Chloroflexota bacterium]